MSQSINKVIDAVNVEKSLAPGEGSVSVPYHYFEAPYQSVLLLLSWQEHWTLVQNN